MTDMVHVPAGSWVKIPQAPRWAGTMGGFQYSVVLSLTHVVTPCVSARPPQIVVAAAPRGSAGVSSQV